MSFAESYELEVLHSRKIRAQRAFFWARVVGIVLMLTIALALRADPQLRSLVIRAGTEGIARVINLTTDAPSQAVLIRPSAPQATALPKARIKINRPGQDNSFATQRQQPDMEAIAAEIERRLATEKFGY